MKLHVVAVTLSALLSCGTGDATAVKPPRYRLEGSVTQVLDLGYDEVRIEVAPEDISVSFVRKQALSSLPTPDSGVSVSGGQSESYPLKLSYTLDGKPFVTGMPVDLALPQSKNAMLQRGRASRNVVNDPRTSFPNLVRGSLLLNGKLAAGESLSGEFNMTFENGAEAASGRTIFGSFSAKVSQ